MGMLDCWFTLVHLLQSLRSGSISTSGSAAAFLFFPFFGMGPGKRSWEVERFLGSLLEPIYKLLSVRYHLLLFVDQDLLHGIWMACNAQMSS